MRISIFLNRDLESNIALNYLLPELEKHKFNLFFSQQIGPAKHALPQLQYLDFLEKEFILTSLFPKLEASPTMGFLSFKQISHQYGVPVTELNEITSARTLSIIEGFKPDLFLSIRFGKIFKGEVLSIPPMGIINLHSAILPAYKGILGTMRSFLDGKNKIGSTIHYINDHTIDSGNIIHITNLDCVADKSVLWHIVHLYPSSIEQLIQIIDKLAVQGQIKSTPQPAGGKYYSFPVKEDFNELRVKGIQFFNLTEYVEILSGFYKIDPHWILKEVRKKGVPDHF